MICYHGGPIWPESAALKAWRNAHAMISFADHRQDALAFACAESVTLDNGAWSVFIAGKGTVDVRAYREWVESWCSHPAFDWCLIPDKIDGDETDNNRLIENWPLTAAWSVPIWHLHESLDKLSWLISDYPRVAFGSSGEYVNIGTMCWWQRIAEAMDVACNHHGFPKAKLHGLRQMDPSIFSVIPYSSVDSTNVARNIGLDSNWTGSYIPARKETRAIVIRDNIQNHASSARWPGIGGIQRNLELFG